MLEFIISNNIVCHAVEAMLFASLSCSILGVIVTQFNVSSIGFTMAHAAFAGAAIGMFLGVNATAAAVVAGILVAILLGPVAEYSRMSTDSILGVFFGMTMAIAIFFIAYMQYLGKGMSASALLFGDVVSLYREEIYALALISIISIIFVYLFYKEISSLIFNRKIAEASGISVKPLYFAILFMIAIAVSLSLNIVGGLLLFVWLVTPAATAYQFCNSLKSMFILAPAIAGVISIAGALAGLAWSVPVAPLTAIMITSVFVVAVIISPKRKISYSKGY
ncbi:MAG: metal ABC transporter permease [Methanomicrobiaceae archaeon]|nr:metal ABC transporter permease [Methanomicrobiaceae archaeon]